MVSKRSSGTRTVRVPAREAPVLAEADVLVCGGGCAGVTAAVSAARRGASVVLVERWPSVGVIAETKHGARALIGRIVIDATGDGDVAAKAGVPFEFGRAEDGRVQGMTMMFCLRGIDREAA